MALALKVLGAVVLVQVALSGIGAMEAVAQQGELTASEPVTLLGTETGEAGANSLTMFGSSIECKVLYTGHQSGSTTEPLEVGATKATITPHYSECQDEEETPLEINMNGCDYVLHFGETAGAVNTFAASLDIVCPEGEAIEFTGGPCAISIPAQSGLNGAHLTHTSDLEADLEGTFTGLHASACGFITTSEGSMHVDTAMHAVLPGHLTADEPVTLLGTETGEASANSLTAFGDTVNCSSTYTGHKYDTTPHQLLPSGSTQVTLTPHYSNCKDSEGAELTIWMNGCDFVLNTAVPSVDIDCPVGEAIEITGGKCAVTFPAQTGLVGVHLRPTSQSGDIDLEGAVAGIHASRCESETTTEAVLHVDLTLSGENELGEVTPISISS